MEMQVAQFALTSELVTAALATGGELRLHVLIFSGKLAHR